MDFSKLLYVFVKIDIRKSKLLHGYLKNYTWISQSCYMDLSKFLYGFIKVVPCVSCPLPNKTRLKFDQEFKARKASAQT